MQANERLNKLRQKLAENNLEAMLVSQPENRQYLSGFTGSYGYILVTPQKAVLATDFRYIEQVKAQAPECELCRVTYELSGWFPRLIAEAGIKKLGFESENITFAQHQKLAPMVEMVPLNGVVESLRAVKEPGEIDLIKQAVKISDDACAYVESILRPGMTELRVAWELEKFMREHGSQSLPFEVIVASGPNAALPHAHPSQHQIQPGEPIIMDFGARFEGYASDITRTLGLGTPDDTFKKIYNIVLQAQQAAISGIEAGMTGAQADGFARKVIEAAGYGEMFGHGLGHGIGLACHESPRLAHTSTDNLGSAMVFTIEPGIYLPGWGGVRIEDTVMLENGKVRVLSQAPKLQV